MAESDQPTVTIEVELSDSSLGPEGPYQSVISGPDQLARAQACELVKEAIQLAIQEALGDEASRPAPREPRH